MVVLWCQIREIYGGSFYFEQGALGARFVGVVFIEEKDPIEVGAEKGVGGGAGEGEGACIIRGRCCCCCFVALCGMLLSPLG